MGSKTHTIFVILVLALSAIAHKTSAQQFSFNSWTTESGLSQNTVYAICEDSDGFMWFGTRNGLNRFDGKNFQVFYPPFNQRNEGADITSLVAGRQNNIWVGLSSGLMNFDLENQVFSPLYINDRKESFVTYSIFKDSQQQIWFATSKGVFRLKERPSFALQRFGIYGPGGIPQENIQCFYQEKNGTVWVGSNLGLTQIKQTAAGIRYKTFTHDPLNFTSISSNIITSIAADGDGHLWVGTQSRGLNLFDKDSESFIRLTAKSPDLPLVNDHIRMIKADTSGNLWIGTQEGVSRLNWDRKTITQYKNDPRDKNSLSQNSVHSIFLDHNNYMWAGTFFGGVNLANPFPSDFRMWQNNGTTTGLSNNVVSSIASDERGNLWIGTEGGGLNYFDRATGQFTYYTQGSRGVGSNLIKTVFKDSDGNIWIGTHAGGLNLYYQGGFKRYFAQPESPAFLRSEISAIAEDPSGHLWLGFQGGIQEVKVYRRAGIQLTDISGSFNLTRLQGKNIKKIFSDSRGTVWVTTSNGLFAVDRDQKTARPLISTELVKGRGTAHITSIQEDQKGNIWFGVEKGGLKKLDLVTSKIFSYSFDKDGAERDVFGILEDKKGFIWLATEKGLIRLDPGSGSFQTYTTADGLPSNSFNYNAYFKDKEGIFYFGGFNGLVSFDPSLFLSNTTFAPVAFTHLKTLGGNEAVMIHQARQIKLAYDQNVFTIDFALLNYIKPEKNRYLYRLKGFEPKWTLTDKPSVTYMNLKPGTYTLAVKGANNDGKWSHVEELQITVQPPFWSTWWAYLVYVLIFSTILFLIIRFFYLKELIKQEEALHQHKLDFFTNITHEIRTHLTLIMSPVDKMITDRSSDGYLQQQFQNIKKNADNLLRLSDELMAFRKAETEHLQLQIAEYDIVAFLKEIYEHFRELSLARDMQITFTHEVPDPHLYFDREQMEKVFINLISNAFKFTPDGGKIEVHISDHNGYIKAAVSDNGRGIAPEYKDKLFNNFFQVNDSGSQNKGYGIGLALSSKIASLHGATIEVDSVPVDGEQSNRTTFAVRLLKGNKHFKQQLQAVQPRVVVIDQKKNNSYEHTEGKAMPVHLPDMEIDTRKLSILVVDDNPDIRHTIQEILADNFEVVLKEEAAQGWTHATDYIPDLIISDVMMPQEDGFHFCFRLKSDTRTCHIPVILLTAKTTQQDHIEGLNRGADIYLTKPFNRNILELTVRNLLTTRERIRERIERDIRDGSFQEVVEDGYITASNELDSVFLKEALAIIDSYLDEPTFNVTVMAQKIGMSVPVLYKKMKAVTNLSVNDFIKSVKLTKAAELLKQNKLAVYEVCYAVGYQDRKHFSAEFKKKFGKSPKQYALSFST